MSRGQKALVGVALVLVTLWGGSKDGAWTNNATRAAKRMAAPRTAQEEASSTPITSSRATRVLDEDDFRRGFVVVGIGTNEGHAFDAPAGATVCADWEAFGAAEDWFYLAVEPRGGGTGGTARVSSNGGVEFLPAASNRWLAPLRSALGLAPRVHWPRIGGAHEETPGLCRPSRFWHDVTPSNTVRFTWQNALFGRDAARPVSVQAEVGPTGRFVYRYDLSCIGADAATDVLVGAAAGGDLAWTTNALASNVTSIAFHPLTAEDAEDADRDGDGLSLPDELFAFGTDPDLWDTDGDGLSDGDEVARGTDPLARDTDADGFADGTDARPLASDSPADDDGDGLPDAWRDAWFGAGAAVPAQGDANGDGIPNLAARLMGANPVAAATNGFRRAGGSASDVMAWEIAPCAFSFARPDALTNLVSRTFTVGRESPWEQFFVSSRPDRAGGWSLEGATLAFGVDGAPPTNAVPRTAADSWRVPLGGAAARTLTFRLVADGARPSLSEPLFLLRWTPRVALLPSRDVMLLACTNGHAYAAVKREADTGRFAAPFETDVSRIPHFGGVDAEIAAELALPPVEGIALSDGSPKAFVASDPLRVDLPREGTNLAKRLLFYDVDFVRTGAVSSGPRASRYASPYPLTSSSLRRAYHAATGEIADGGVTVRLSPDVPELGYAVGASRGRARLLGAAGGGAKTGTIPVPSSVSPTVCGDPCTNDTRDVEHEYPEDHDETPDEDDGDTGDGEDDDDCDCGEEGGTSLGSFRIRIPFGESAEGVSLGYLWKVVERPAAITPLSFGVLAAPGMNVVTNADGTLSIGSAVAGGKTVLVTNVAHGVAIPVWNASGRFESEWRVWAEEGDAARIRVRRNTAAGNATVDETYDTWTDEAPVVFGAARGAPATAWRKTDNLRGVARTRREWRDAAEGDFIAEEYEETELDGVVVRAEQRVYGRIGAGATARRRLLRTRGFDERGDYETARTYWCDAGHPGRHARLRSLNGTRPAWTWRDYDAQGRETVRVEPFDGSAFPALDGVSLSAPLPDGCRAKVTVTSYAPRAGDDAHRNDSFRPREIATYLRDGAAAPVPIARETRVYTREADASGNPLRRIETAVGLGDAVRSGTRVEYPQDSAAPAHLRGLPVLETHADGSTTRTAYALSDGRLAATARTSFDGVGRPTYAVSVTDPDDRLTLREETRLAADDAVLDWREHSYDDLHRLRRTVHSDGTYETNAYSCCRLLWTRDREGRKVLRSARTGRDALHYADENVWLAEVSTNGAFVVVQHDFDGLGRETAATTHLGTTPGEAAVAYAPSAAQRPSARTAVYRDGEVTHTDARGRVTLARAWTRAGVDGSSESVSGDGGETFALTSRATRGRDGGMVAETEWGDRWRRETTAVDYDVTGHRVETVTVEASDHEAVTNSVTRTDALGRIVETWTPGGTTAFVYAGASSRLLRTEFSAGGVFRVAQMLYSAWGERVGTALDGVTNRTDVAYERISNAWWKVTTACVVGPDTNAVMVAREQLTGLGDGLRARTVSLDAKGLKTRSERIFDETAQLETETVRRSDGTWETLRRRHGLVVEKETEAGRAVTLYDGFGRVARTETTAGEPTTCRTVTAYDYADNGDLLAVKTFTNATDFVVESYGHDVFGNRVAVTNALGEVTETAYDARGNATSVRGAAYPVERDYDTEGRCVALRTTRDGAAWDETRWDYDAATGLCVAKTYADGSTVTYTYTPDSLPLRTTYAGGRWIENVYDARRQVVGVCTSDGEQNVTYDRDEYGREVGASNAVAQTSYRLSVGGAATNETRTLGTDVTTLVRAVGDSGRMIGVRVPSLGYECAYGYATNGVLSSVSNADAVVTYAYSDDLRDAGYTISFRDGASAVRTIVRDAHLRDVVSSVTDVAGNVSHGIDYFYDALRRPIRRGADEFAYNSRGEVTAATIADRHEVHDYDDIGNALFAAQGCVTNIYRANALNQYTAIATDGSSRSLVYDLDGNLLSDGVCSYAYDALMRLSSVSSNGVVLLENQYDHRGRRIRRTTPESTTTFLYDDWNLIHEREVAGAVTNETLYYWGKDLSGSLQGSGGIGGLLYMKRNGTIYVPHCDAYGNIVRCTDTAGEVMAEYAYGAFGDLLSATGPMSDAFRIRFSSKYLDPETGLYYYGYRFYSPALMRWLNRDPIEERGGVNVYQFVKNIPTVFYDTDGRFVLPIMLAPYSESSSDSSGNQSPSVFDQFGSANGSFHEEEWFRNNYSGWIASAREKFIHEINASIDCKTEQMKIRSSRQSVSPGVAGDAPWGMPTGGNDRIYGDKGQNNWQATAVLGSFVIDYVTPVHIKYGACNNGHRPYSWSTTMYVEDVLGLQGNEGWVGKYFGWAAKSRRVKRAQWTISGRGICSCCE